MDKSKSNVNLNLKDSAQTQPLSAADMVKLEYGVDDIKDLKISGDELNSQYVPRGVKKEYHQLYKVCKCIVKRDPRISGHPSSKRHDHIIRLMRLIIMNESEKMAKAKLAEQGKNDI